MESGRAIQTVAGKLSLVSMGGTMTSLSTPTPWSPRQGGVGVIILGSYHLLYSLTWFVNNNGGHQLLLLFSMLAVSLVTSCSAMSQTGKAFITSKILQRKIQTICRYGRRTAFFIMLAMEVVLSMALAFSPNYIVYTIIR